jgi:hypothetical protein
MTNATPLALPPSFPTGYCFPRQPSLGSTTVSLAAPGPVQQAEFEFALLEAWLSSAQVLQLPLHQVEAEQYTRSREVHRLLLQAHIQSRGTGDLGPALRVRQDACEVLYTHRRLSTRSLKTVFGPIEITRMGYSHAGSGGIYPLDTTLALPARLFSYELAKAFSEGGGARPLPGIRRWPGRSHRCMRSEAKPGGGALGCCARL